ncbi:MAG: CHRD domain-containing protein [Planctomycetota bacterium]
MSIPANHMILRFGLATLLTAALAQAQTLTYEFRLDERQLVTPPPVLDGASGSGRLIFDTATRNLTISGSFSGLTSPVTGVALFSGARRGANGTAALTCTPSGRLFGTFTAISVLTVAQSSLLRDGLAYIQLTTASRTLGALRGQIDSVPGSGTAQTVLPNVSGAATAGGSLQIWAGASTVVLVGVALPPGTSLPLRAPWVCPIYPGGLALDPTYPFFVLPSAISLPIPRSLSHGEIAVQGVNIAVGCPILMGGFRIAIRP